MKEGKPRFKAKGFEDHPPWEDKTGQTWEETTGHGGSKLFLLLGDEGGTVQLLDLETGERDSVHWSTFAYPVKSWRRVG